MSFISLSNFPADLVLLELGTVLSYGVFIVLIQRCRLP